MPLDHYPEYDDMPNTSIFEAGLDNFQGVSHPHGTQLSHDTVQQDKSVPQTPAPRETKNVSTRRRCYCNKWQQTGTPLQHHTPVTFL